MVVSHANPACGENRSLQGFSRVLRPLFEALTSQAVRYIVLRNHEGYPDAMHKPDIGLLIDPVHADRLVAVVREVCCRQHWKCHQETWRRDNIVLILVIPGATRRDGDIETVKVDARMCETFRCTSLQERVFGLAVRIFYEQLTRRTVTQQGCTFAILDQPDALIGEFKQWKRKGDARHRERIIDMTQHAHTAKFLGDATGVSVDGLSAKLPSQWNRACDRLMRQMVQHRWGTQTLPTLVTSGFRVLWARMKRPWLIVAPMIYFAGPDGCGKTTMVRGLEQMLQHSRVRYKYFYSYKRVIRFLARRMAWLKFRGSRHSEGGELRNELIRSEHADRDTGGMWWRMRKRLALLMGLVDIAIGYCLAMPYRLIGRTVLVETSPYDVFIKYHMPEFTWIETFAAPLLPKPTSCYVLRAESEAIFARKPELTRDEIEGYYQRLETVLRRAKLGDRLREVRTDGVLDESLARMWSAVMDQLADAQMGRR